MSDRTSGRFQSIKILLIFGLAILCFAVPFTVARFVAKDSAKDGAQVAYAVIDAIGEGEAEGKIDVATAQNYEYTVTVSNKKDGRVSEVDMEYMICIELPSGFPPMRFEVSDTQAPIEITETTTEPTLLEFKSSVTLASGTEMTNTHTVTVKGTENTVGAFEGLDVKIRVKAEQID